MLNASLTAAGGAAALVGLVMLCYLLSAASFKARCKQRANARFQASRPGERQLPPQLARLTERASQSLDKLGFRPAWDVRTRDLVPNATVMLLIFDSPDSGDSAMVSLVGLHAADDDSRIVRIHLKHLEFTSYFSDGGELTTHNSNRDSVTARASHKRFLQFPDARDPALLYRLHRRGVRQVLERASQSSLSGQELLDRVCHDFSWTMQGQCESGYFRLDARGDYYRPTWKGALVMTWRKLWPNTALRCQRRRRRTRELLRCWGMDELGHPVGSLPKA